MGKIIEKILINEPEAEAQRCLIAVHGRGATAELMMEFCQAIDLPDTLIVSMESRFVGWYPQPNGINDQINAVRGLRKTSDEFSRAINKIKHGWKLKEDNITLIGHSAGAVLSLYTAIHSKHNFNSVISMAGAIFEPENIPQCNKTTTILLQHNEDDDCFNWDERYIPMCQSLKDNKYNLRLVTHSYGGHNSFTLPVLLHVQEFLASQYNVTIPDNYKHDNQETSDHQKPHD